MVCVGRTPPRTPFFGNSSLDLGRYEISLLNAEEHDFPIIGPAAGYYFYQLARMIGARSIFAMGSGYGYSTAWFARAVQEK